MFQDILSSNARAIPRQETFVGSDYIDDDLPLPSFPQVFGFSVAPPSLSRSHKRRMSGSENVDTRMLSKRLKLEEFDKNKGHHDSGRWTSEEHRLFLEGVMLYGKDWKKMQPLIKTRTLVQIRTHAQKVFKKIGLKRLGPDTLTQTEKSSQSVALASALPPNSDNIQDNQSDEASRTNRSSSQIPDVARSKTEVTVQSSNTVQSVSQLVESVANVFRGYDMEVTDEEFNLVVQHLKNLGEIRGEDLSDEGDDGSVHETNSRQNDIDRSRIISTKGSATYAGKSAIINDWARNSSDLVEISSVLPNTAMMQEDSSILHPLQRQDDEKECDSKGQQAFGTDDDMQNHHLLQTLRQYLMPDNDHGDGFSTTEYF